MSRRRHHAAGNDHGLRHAGPSDAGHGRRRSAAVSGSSARRTPAATSPSSRASRTESRSSTSRNPSSVEHPARRTVDGLRLSTARCRDRRIRVTEGDRVRINVTNQLPEITTVHWHGLIVPNAMDGPAEITQEPIPPGETFTYEFTPGNTAPISITPMITSTGSRRSASTAR